MKDSPGLFVTAVILVVAPTGFFGPVRQLAEIFLGDFYPAAPVRLLPYGALRKWKYAQVEFSPVQWNPTTGAAQFWPSVEVSLEFERLAPTGAAKATATPGSPEADDKSLSIELVAVRSLTIPVIIRVGTLDATATIDGATLARAPEDMLVVKMARTGRFKKAWGLLSERAKKSGRKAIENLAIDMNYPSLRVKKIKGTDKLWEARASHSLRITFEIDSNIIVLRNIGKHDQTLKQP
jgi:mRNA-degrading endonuclease RelE of RelBE toxin-antitoxin system